MPIMRGRAGALFAAALSAAAFGTSGPFAKALLDAGWSPSAAVLARIGGAALVLLPATIAAWRRHRPSPDAQRLTVLYGVIAVAGAQLCFFSAVRTLSVGVALLLEYTAPLLLVGWSWARTRRIPATRTLVAAAVSLAGLALVLDLTGGVRLDLVGVLWGAGAAVCLSGYFVMSADARDDLPPVLLAGAGLTVAAVVIALIGVAGLLPLEASSVPVGLFGARTSFLVPVVILILLSSVFAYVTGIVAAARLGPRIASFVGLTEVLFAVLFAWALLGQLPTGMQLLGGVLVLAGVVSVRDDPPVDASGAHGPSDHTPVPVLTH